MCVFKYHAFIFCMRPPRWRSETLPVCFPSWGTRVQSPGGYLCESGILLLALSRYIDDPDVIDHFCGLVWGGFRPEPSLGHHADNVIISLDLTKLFGPSFTLAVGPPSSYIFDIVCCLGGSPVESLQSHCIYIMSHWSSGLPVCFLSWGAGFNPQGVLMWNQDSPVSVVSLRYRIHLNVFVLKKLRTSTFNGGNFSKSQER
jgi:hypothetical protein